MTELVCRGREWSSKMSPADRDEQTHWDERLARTDAGELYGVGVHNISMCDHPLLKDH